MRSWFSNEVLDHDRLALFLCFATFIITFVTTRVITRTIRAGRGPFKNNVSSSGIHVHHAVPGIILLIVGAFIAVGTGSEPPWAEIAGVLVGMGTSLVLDEFALILHLQDVYWTDEGRVSVEMASLAVACLGLTLVGVSPFSFDGDAGDYAAIATAVVGLAVHLSFILLCIAKGKYKMALFGTFLPMVAVVCSIRLARPGSRWAKRRYAEAKTQRAVARAARYDRHLGPVADWLSDFIAGKPSEPDPEPTPP